MQKEAGAETSSFYCALLRIQPRIAHCWRPLRRAFKPHDRGGAGFLRVAAFRKLRATPAGPLPLNGKRLPKASGQKTSK